MNFKQFLAEVEYGRNFGRIEPKVLEKPQKIVPIGNYNKDTRYQSIDQRVNYGRGIEKQIFDSLVKCGMKLREPSLSEDKYDKIDAWWQLGSREVPIQIKYRENRKDILFEVLKDYWAHTPGRDMISKSKYYAVLMGDSISVFSVDEIKNLVNNAMKESDMAGFDDKGFYRGMGVTLRISPDPYSKQEKLLAYILPEKLHPIRQSCKLY